LIQGQSRKSEKGEEIEKKRVLRRYEKKKGEEGGENLLKKRKE